MTVIPVSSDTYRQNVGDEKLQKDTKPKFLNIRKILIIILIILIIVLLLTVIILLIKIFSSNKDNIKCHEGFFNPSDHELMCYQCSIPHCKECIGEVNNNICNSCFEGFIPDFNDKKKLSIVYQMMLILVVKNALHVIQKKKNVLNVNQDITFQIIVKINLIVKNVHLKIVKVVMELKIQIFVTYVKTIMNLK